MKKIALLIGGATLALSVLTAPVAFAQDDRACDQAKREVARIEARLAATITEERRVEELALKDAQAALEVAKTNLENAVPGADLPALRAIRDAARGAVDAARAALTQDSARLVRVRVDLKVAIESRDEACKTPPTTTTPPPTVTTTVTPPPADVDCEDVSDAEAQRLLNEDRSDPHNLDDDNDGVACEEDVQRPTVVVPNGGVNTGGGPE